MSPIAIALAIGLLTGGIGPAGLKGEATWYATCDHCAAASGRLQDAIGSGWKGTWVTVSRGSKSVSLKLITGYGCGKGRHEKRIIDLSPWAFSQFAPLSRGVLQVTVVPIDVPSLPPTDTE